MHYPATELVLDAKGRVYHLGLAPHEIADKIVLVGDQDRVALAASLFDEIEHSSQHREFVCQTGIFQGKRISILSTGIGTDNIDIVINELDALVNIDIEARTNKPVFKSLDLVRVGTCGILQAEIPVHGYLLTTEAFGLDNIAHFYQIPFNAREIELSKAIERQVQLPADIKPYLCEGSPRLLDKLRSEETHSGITVTSSGFYGPQGRQLRLSTKTASLNDALSRFEFSGKRIINFEMESSALYALGKALGHHCATICLGIANRPNKEFSKGYEQEMVALMRYVLERI